MQFFSPLSFSACVHCTFFLASQMKRSSLKHMNTSLLTTKPPYASRPNTVGQESVCVCVCVRFFSRVPSLRPFDAELHCLAEPQEIEREDQAERQRESGRTPGLSGTRHTEMNSPGVTRGRRGARRVCEGARGGRGEQKVKWKRRRKICS